MKRAVLMIVFLEWALMAGAQVGFRYVTARIPFDFQVNGAPMPAGHYEFRLGSTGSIMVRESGRQESGRFAITSEVDERCKGSEAVVTFKQIGNLYFLRTIVYPGYARVAVFQSGQEKKLLKIASKEVEVKAEDVGK